MSTLNTLSAGYKSNPTATNSTNVRPTIVDTSKKINAEELTNRIKMWHADGVLSTKGINYIISQLQTII